MVFEPLSQSCSAQNLPCPIFVVPHHTLSPFPQKEENASLIQNKEKSDNLYCTLHFSICAGPTGYCSSSNPRQAPPRLLKPTFRITISAPADRVLLLPPSAAAHIFPFLMFREIFRALTCASPCLTLRFCARRLFSVPLRPLGAYGYPAVRAV